MFVFLSVGILASRPQHIKQSLNEENVLKNKLSTYLIWCPSFKMHEYFGGWTNPNPDFSLICKNLYVNRLPFTYYQI